MKILAILPEAATVAACLDMAEAAARGVPEARIDLLHVVVDPAQLVGADEMIDMQYLRIRREGSAATRATATRAAFDDWRAALPDLPVSPVWHEAVGDETETLCEWGRRYDLLVLPRGLNLDGADAMHAAFFCAGRPFFLAPHPGLVPTRPLSDRVVIAWNGTSACRRAAEAARPWLRAGGQPVVMLIGEDDGGAEGFVGDLRAEGVSIETRRLARDREALGDQLVTEARALDATLLVMGAFRHATWLEWLLGGTTRQALHHATLPYLMAH